MLQRAASSAYSWWWASHIRTKQSKWLEQNLQDMEGKVGYVLKIIDHDGDSFAKRAEMYYRKRPELVGFVEEVFRAYRALAERYDHMSKELQNCNRTIAAVFPEQIQLAMEEDEEFVAKTLPALDLNKTSGEFQGSPTIPKIPSAEFKPPAIFVPKKRQLRKSCSSARPVVSSGLSKAEALEEIDKMQKAILVVQTEKEFVKSSYERGAARYCEMDNQINEMQAKVYNLQDEYGIGTAIDDDEARRLMAATAIKSCQDSLVQLQEKHESLAKDAKDECKRVNEADEKVKTLKHELLNQSDRQELAETTIQSDSLDPLDKHTEHERMDSESIREKIEKFQEWDPKKPLTVSELAEQMDEVVEMVITMETALSSQTALVNRLRSETNDLLTEIQSLVKEKEALTASSDMLLNKLIELEEELNRLKSLKKRVEEQNTNLRVNFTEASCNLDHLSEKSQNVKPDEDDENLILSEENESSSDANLDKGIEIQDALAAPATSLDIAKYIEETKDDSQKLGISGDDEEQIIQFSPSANVDILPEDTGQEPEQENALEKGKFSEAGDSDLENVWQELGMEGDQPNWKELFIHGLEDREKFLLEYSSVLRTLKEVKRKFSDGEKKSRESLLEQAMQIREIRNVNIRKNEEIQALRQKLNALQMNSGDNHLDTPLTEQTHSELGKEDLFQTSEVQSPSDQRTVYDLLYGRSTGKVMNAGEPIPRESSITPKKGNKIILLSEPRPVSAAEEKLRIELDDMLEENLEFWLKFSTAFHQIQKFQSSIQDLQGELIKLREKKKQEGGSKLQKLSLQLDARPIYKYLREIQTELKVWLECTSLLKDEVQSRYSSLNNIQDEISRMTNSGGAEEMELGEYRAAKFQGEVTNMKQESNKVECELQLGLNKVKRFHLVIERTLATMEEEFEIAGTRHSQTKSTNKPRIPLQSFLFGVKLKKQKPKPSSIFSCMNSALQKQHSELTDSGNGIRP